MGSAISRHSSFFVSASVVGFLLTSAPRASAQGALSKFEEAFRLVSSPKILFNMGKAHLALGDEAKADEAFERFLDEAPYAPKESRDEAQRRVETLRPHLAYLEVQTDDVGSTISIDGRVVGTAPLARPSVVLPGSHQVLVEKSEMAPQSRQVSPIAGQKLRVVVKLVSAAASPAATATPPPFAPLGGPAPPATAAPSPGPNGASLGVDVTAPPSSGENRGHSLRTTGLVLGGAGAAVTIVGIVFGVAAKADGDANAKTGATISSSTYDAGHRDQTLQYVGYALGAALIAGGVATWVIGSGHEKQAVTTPVVSFAPVTGGALASAALRF